MIEDRLRLDLLVKTILQEVHAYG